jgi:hypothetical protein
VGVDPRDTICHQLPTHPTSRLSPRASSQPEQQGLAGDSRQPGGTEMDETS